ncbi:MAG TPA: energy transducer TonB, partial [Acetobacteraceae bacterium]|nr:energy transducer TonB [Acetobacteraceae bacterium]
PPPSSVAGPVPAPAPAEAEPPPPALAQPATPPAPPRTVPQREAAVRPPTRPATPPPRPAFPNALDLSTGPTPRLESAPSPRRPVDTRPGAPRIGDPAIEPILQISGARETADWRNLFRAWMERNKFYPRDAAALGEQGPVRLRIIVEPDGRVRSVDLTRPHYSNLLNGGALALFRGRTLPPFPPGTTDPQVTIDLTINYILIGR